MQSVPALFNQLADGDVRPHSWGLRVSFTKQFDDSVTFFTLNQSQLNGVDVLAPADDNPIQAWDYYEYVDYSDRIIYMSYQRELEFPYSTVAGIADFQLNNYDKYFTPGSASPISNYILPKRPVRLLQGLGMTLLPQFVGLTQGMPELDRNSGTATFTAMDFLTQIYDMNIRSTIAMQNVRTDEVLAEIFDQFGITPGQYDLAKGRNVIPFLFFEEDQIQAGTVIKRLMEAEGGMLWLDELGIIRFRPRLEQPDTPVYYFNSENIVSLQGSEDDQIINRVTVTAEVRRLQDPQIIFSVTHSGDDRPSIDANGSAPYYANLNDPSINIDEPSVGEVDAASFLLLEDIDGNIIESNITVTAHTDLTNTYIFYIDNNNSFPVYVSRVQLWGEPAKVVGGKPAIYDIYDEDSKEAYEEHVLPIENNFIQSIDQARSLALTILDGYKDFSSIIEFEAKGNCALQLGDVIELDYEEYNGQWRIISEMDKLQDQKHTQIIKAKQYTPRNWFTLDQSQLNGMDVLAP